MRKIRLMLSILAVTGIIWIDSPGLIAQQNGRPQPGYQWSNTGANGPGWLSQYPLSAQTTQMPSFSSSFPLGINPTTGLTSNGENLLVAEGQLSRIDSQGQRLWIRTPEEKEMVFYYTSAMQTLGAGASAQGLARRSGDYLRVLYTREGGRDHAVQITMEPSSTPVEAPSHRVPMK